MSKCNDSKQPKSEPAIKAQSPRADGNEKRPLDSLSLAELNKMLFA